MFGNAWLWSCARIGKFGMAQLIPHHQMSSALILIR